MPYERIIEMLCDFVGAGKAYNNNKWTTNSPLDYWNKKCEGQRAMHADSEKLFKQLLVKMSECATLEEFVDWYNKNCDKLETEYNK